MSFPRRLFLESRVLHVHLPGNRTVTPLDAIRDFVSAEAGVLPNRTLGRGEIDGRGFRTTGELAPIEPAAVAQRIAIAQQEHRQAIVEAAVLADLLALVEYRPGHAVDHPRQHRVREPADRKIERGVPGVAKADCVGSGPQGISRPLGPPDRAASLGDAAALRQRLDEVGLPSGGPTVPANAGANRLERGLDERVVVVLFCFLAIARPSLSAKGGKRSFTTTLSDLMHQTSGIIVGGASHSRIRILNCPLPCGVWLKHRCSEAYRSGEDYRRAHPEILMVH